MQCKAHIQKNGALQTGKSVLIKVQQQQSQQQQQQQLSPTSLFKYIIFTCNPTWLGGNKGEEVKLKECIHQSLELVHRIPSEEKITSVIFPAIATSSSLSVFPKDKTALVMTKTLYDWFQLRKDKTSVKEVKFIASTDGNSSSNDMVNKWNSNLESLYKQKVVSNNTSSSSDTGSNSDNSNSNDGLSLLDSCKYKYDC